MYFIRQSVPTHFFKLTHSINNRAKMAAEITDAEALWTSYFDEKGDVALSNGDVRDLLDDALCAHGLARA